MLKGYQRKLIMMPTRDSSLFETAYFVLKGDAESRNPGQGEMLCEAMRILEENHLTRKRTTFTTRHIILSFLGGFLCGTLLLLVIALIKLL